MSTASKIREKFLEPRFQGATSFVNTQKLQTHFAYFTCSAESIVFSSLNVHYEIFGNEAVDSNSGEANGIFVKFRKRDSKERNDLI